MDRRARQLLEAHVAFELEQWQGEALEAQLDAEVGALWSWAGKTRLDAVTSAARVRATAQRLVIDMPLPESLATLIGDIAGHLIALPLHRETRVEEVVDKDLFDDCIEQIIDLRHLRNVLIRRLSDSPLYAMLASELLYYGIKDYVFSEKGLTRAVPGVSALLSKGSSAVNKRLPGLEAQVEKRVRAYLESNMARTLQRSEAIMLNALTEERLRSLAAEIWAAARDVRLSPDDLVTGDDAEALAAFGLDIWRRLRRTDYVAALIDAGIERFFARHGRLRLATVCKRVGITEALLRQEALAVVPPLAASARETGYLEGFIRRRLEPFYRSRAAAASLS